MKLRQSEVIKLITLMGKCPHQWINSIPVLSEKSCRICGRIGYEPWYLDFSTRDLAWQSFGRLIDWATKAKQKGRPGGMSAIHFIEQRFGGPFNGFYCLKIDSINPIIFARIMLDNADKIKDYTVPENAKKYCRSAAPI